MVEDIDSSHEPDDMPWEYSAKMAVESAWRSADLDDVRGVIAIFDHDERRLVSKCKSLDELRSTLSSVYAEAWYSYVPFESGEAVFSDNAEGYVESFLAVHGEVEQFFGVLSVEESEADLFQSDEFVQADKSSILQVDLSEINDELIRRLAREPELMRRLDPRKFEILVAELLRDKGYEVELTPPSKDGGRDILAIQRDDIGSALTLVECKRYAHDNRVGVDIVRGLYGVVSAENATKGLVATTSYFTSKAKAFRDKVPYRLSLADFDVLKGMLSRFHAKR